MPGKVSEQRIVYQHDIHALLSAVCWIACHGNTDDSLSHRNLSVKAKTDKLFLTCGYLCYWAHTLLALVGIKSRRVAGLTLETWNHYDNGHDLLEVWRDDLAKWVLYDLDNHCYFSLSDSDTPLDFITFCRVATHRQDYRIHRLAKGAGFDVSNFAIDGASYCFMLEYVQNNLREWYAKILQVPLIRDLETKTALFMDDTDIKRVESYSPRYRYLPAEQFISRFYPD